MQQIADELHISYPTSFKYCKMLDAKLMELQEHPEQMMSKRELAILNEQKKERESSELRKDLKNIIGSVAEELKKHGEK